MRLMCGRGDVQQANYLGGGSSAFWQGSREYERLEAGANPAMDWQRCVSPAGPRLGE